MNILLFHRRSSFMSMDLTITIRKHFFFYYTIHKVENQIQFLLTVRQCSKLIYHNFNLKKNMDVYIYVKGFSTLKFIIEILILSRVHIYTTRFRYNYNVPNMLRIFYNTSCFTFHLMNSEIS